MDKFIALLQAVTPDEFNKVVLGVVALIALFVSPLVQWQIAKRQANLQENVAKRQAELQEQIAQRQVEIQSDIAKRQAADNVSSKRQVWIDELRKETAEIAVTSMYFKKLRDTFFRLPLDQKEAALEKIEVLDQRISELAVRIRLRLDPDNQEHAKVGILVVKYLQSQSLNPGNEAGSAVPISDEALLLAVIDQVQAVIHQEWQRVRTGQV